MQSLADTWEKNSELRSALTNPAFNIEQRIDAAKQIALNIRPGDEKFSNFVCLLCESSRLNNLPLISDAFSGIVAELKKILALEVTSAFEISAAERESFTDRIQKEFGSLASVKWHLDPEIIGGLRVRAGDRLLDNSIKGALNRLENTLLA